jgi:hypothetical protein
VPTFKDIADIASTVQQHTCNSLCGGLDKKDESGKVIKKGKCKAKFPRPHEVEETRVRYTTTFSRKTKKWVTTVGVEVGRKYGDRNTNGYHLLTLEIWRANTDAQLVVCIKSGTRYVTKYVNKEEQSSAAFNQMESDFIRKVKQESLSRKAVTLVKSLMHNFVKARNVGGHELYMLINYGSLVYTDIKSVWVNLNPGFEITEHVLDKLRIKTQTYANKWKTQKQTPDREAYRLRLS